jgi:hypothetical protein
LRRAGFQPAGPAYTDPADGLHWQNVAWSAAA